MESTNPESKKRRPGRQRRQYAKELKAGVVWPVLVEGRSVTQVARDLDLTRSALDAWVQQAKADADKGPAGALTSAEREGRASLPHENEALRMGREILENSLPVPRSRRPETRHRVG